MTGPAIVPIELVLSSGRWFTLYQRDWDDADDDSLAFLGDGDQVFALPSAGQLATYVGGAPVGHHLAASALWAEVPHRTRSSFEPAPGDRYDLTVDVGAGRPSPETSAAKAMLVELIYFLGLDGLVARIATDPLADVLRIPRFEGMENSSREAPRDRRDPQLIALDEVERQVGPPGKGASIIAVESMIALEDAAPGVEALWLGLCGDGAHTLVRRDDDNEWAFLGRPGQLAAATSVEALAAALQTGADPRVAGAPWAALNGLESVDCEPYEDNVVDLDELGALIDDNLSRSTATALLDAWPLLAALLLWTGGPEATRPLDEDQPLGRFLVRDVIDISTGTAAAGRLATVDLDEVRVAWEAAVAFVYDRAAWLES